MCVCAHVCEIGFCICVHVYMCRHVHAQPISSPALLRGEVVSVIPSTGVITTLPLALPVGAGSKSLSASGEAVATSTEAAAVGGGDTSAAVAEKLSSSAVDVGP